MSLTSLKTLLRCSRHGRHLTNLNARPLMTSVTNHIKKTTDENEEEDPTKPLVYTRSNAASMTVDDSFGNKYKRPVSKVVPICVVGIGLLIWAYTRKETEVDKILSADLKDTLPGLFEDDQRSTSRGK